MQVQRNSLRRNKTNRVPLPISIAFWNIATVKAQKRQHRSIAVFSINHVTESPTLECMAGTTGLEPATSAVTVSHTTVTHWNQEARMATLSTLRNLWEPVLHPQQTHDLCPVDLCPTPFFIDFFRPLAEVLFRSGVPKM